MKECILFDHDGVLVDTEHWYFLAGQQALAEVGFTHDREQYLRDMAEGAGTWAQARRAGIAENTLVSLRHVRNAYYQEFLRTQPIEIDGVVEVLQRLSRHVRMAIVTTSKRADFELIHRHREIVPLMDFVLVREDFEHPKPHPEPYMKGLARYGVSANQALVVEDSARGLRSAVAAGIDCAVVHNAFTADQDFTGARYRLQSLGELEAILQIHE